jgi:hypothetical protein
MSSIEQYVDVQISQQTTAVSKAGFGTLLIVGPNPTFSERTKAYTPSEMAGLASDLTGGATDPEYRAASTLISQNPRVTRFKVGRIDGGDADMTATLDAIKNEDNDWYGLMTVERNATDDLAASAWAQTNKKIFGVADDDANIIASGDTTSTPKLMFDNSRNRSFALYSGQADGSASDPFAEAGLFGIWMPQTPGSYTVMYKSMSGVVADVLTSSQLGYAAEKFCNTYHEVGGVQIIDGGWVSQGTVNYIDIMVFVDWLQARMTERIFSRLVNLAKIPFTDAGIDLIVAEVKGQLQDGIDAGGLAADPAPVVEAPAAADVDTTDKANRLLPDITFTATLAGAIHKIQVRGVVTL